MIRNRPTALTSDRDRHRRGRGGLIVSALVPGEERQPDDPGGEALQRRDPALGGLAAPDRLGSDDLGRGACGNADERPADQRGEDDDRRRCRVPAARAELDDDALRRGGRERRAQTAIGNDVSSAAPATAQPERRRHGCDERDPDRDAGAARGVGDAWSRTASSVLAPSPPCRSWTRHLQLIKRERRPRRYPPIRGSWPREPRYRRF